MYVAAPRSQPQQLGFWDSLISAAVQIGSKVVDKSIAKKNAQIEQQRIALEEKRQQLELTKLQNQQRIAEMQLQREMSNPISAPFAAVQQTLSRPVAIPGVGNIPLSYIAIPAVAILAVALLKRK